MQPVTPDDATEVLARGRGAAAPRETQFAPGTMVADRYRIVSLLGSGGMGEVYRADDVKLGQRVAMKYLSPRIPADHLYNEVRIGRQISHPNVCRLHDVVEVDGHRFISMEYVDGEDLASLLRRIGRLPADKALVLARDICAGLAAAHDRGVIHRDLKPANVMIDGRGSARITDFGLAALAAEGARDFGGTPLYMAPEQLEHGTTSIRSDLYALGLVMFEMFTGRRVFTGATAAELRSQHSMEKTRPSTLVHEIDPAVERVILRCLEEDPADRPGSVREVMAMLPGGDPLQAAVAAGETPSPELVAAAGREGGLEAGRAWAMLLVFLAMLVAAAALRERRDVTSYIRDVKPPDALVADARAAIRAFGYNEKPADWDVFYVRDNEYVRKYRAAHRSAETLPPYASSLLYRDSPEPLLPRNPLANVGRDDPAPVKPGMTTVMVDATGKLRELRRVPPAQAKPSDAAPDWTSAFRAAGLDLAHFRETSPEWTPPVASDHRRAWIGKDPSGVRVEAATMAGKPVWFTVLDAWSTPLKPTTLARSNILAVIFLLAAAAAAVFARRNVRQGRGDMRGAMRVGAGAVAVLFASTAVVAHHTGSLGDEWSLLTTLAGDALFFGGLTWLSYLAIEPHVRRRWPQMLVGWTRLVGGRTKDPLVGTEVLVGLLSGTAGALVSSLVVLALARFGAAEPENILASTPVVHLGGTLANILYAMSLGVLFIFFWLTLLVLFRKLLRNETAAWIALPATIMLSTAGGESPLVSVATSAASIILAALALRFAGVLAAAVSISVSHLFTWTPLTMSTEVWYFGRSTLVLLLLAVVGIFAFRRALAGKPLFGSALVEDGAAA